MKKVFLIFAFAAFGMVNAQKGTILVGGNVSYKSVKNPVDEFNYPASIGVKTNVFEFSPKVGYQFTKSLTVGVEATYGTEKRTDVVVFNTEPSGGFLTNVEVEKTNLNVGAFLRYSKTLSGPFSAYADLSVGYQSGKASRALFELPYEVKYDGIYAGITPAVAVDLKKSLLLNFSIGGIKYSSINTDFSESSESSSLEFDFGKQINIGISKNF